MAPSTAQHMPPVETSTAEIGSSDPPGPQSWCFGFDQIPRMRRDLLEFGLNLQREFGDAAMVRIAGQRVFHFAHPSYVEDVLVHRVAAFRKPAFFHRVFGRWIGDGIATSEKEDWIRRRKMVQSALQRLAPHDQAEMVARHVRRLVTDHAGGEIDLSDALQRVAFSVITEVVFGRDNTAACDPLFDASEYLQFAGVAKMSSMVPVPYFLPTSTNRQIAKCVQEFEVLVQDRLDRWRSDRRPTTHDLVGNLLEERDEQGRGLSDKEIRDEAVTMIFGGKETAGFSLTWTGYLLARHPEVQEKCLDELRHVLGDRPATCEDLPQLKYLEMVCKEAMRLYPPAYMMCRQATEATQVGRYRIPKGSLVLLLTYGIHRDPRWFNDPDDFIPERFAHGVQDLPKFAYFPFGGGRRVCVGGRLAMLESILTVANLVKSCVLRLPADHVPPALGTDVALHPRGKLMVGLERRD